MIAKYKKTTVKWFFLALALILVVGYSSSKTPNSNDQTQKIAATINQGKDTYTAGQKNTNSPEAPSLSSEDTKSILYKNTQYGFYFKLPESWKGYSIVSSQWQGLAVGGESSEKVTETGPIISIRNPRWTSQTPYQDIPIMVFTIAQWNSLQKGLFHIGAAPIGPSELGRNKIYVFALPARYNYAFPEGYKEVEEILESKPLQAY